jgi:hypothetical protein
MFGALPPFYSPFPYGAVPSSGVPSGLFVDLFNAQTVAGAKTFTDSITFNKAASGTETIWTATVSDDANASVILSNRSGSASRFEPLLAFTCGNFGTAIGGTLRFRIQTGQDTGTSDPIAAIDCRVGTATAATSKDLLWIQNNSTPTVKFTAAGGVTIDGGTAPALTMGGRINAKSYTVATLPAVGVAGGIIYVSDAAVAPCLAFSNGTNWKRCDNAATTVV